MRNTSTSLCVSLNTHLSLAAQNSLFDGFAGEIFISRAVVLGIPAPPLPHECDFVSMQKEMDQFRLQTQAITEFGSQRSFSRS